MVISSVVGSAPAMMYFEQRSHSRGGGAEDFVGPDDISNGGACG
jgi:hypothetical protein